MIEKLVRPEIRNYIPYNANQIPYRVKLDANESPFGLPESIRMKIAGYFAENPVLNLYPDSDSIELRKRLASYWKAAYEGIVIGTGSDQIIQTLVNVFVGRGDRVICPVPSFSMYSLATIIAGGLPVDYYLNDDFQYDIDEIIRLTRIEKAKIVFLCSPNNPTGNTIPIEAIMKLVEECEDSVIVVDEAYAEFSGETASSLVSIYDNLVILRSFSKAYGLAGIRCGYSISSTEIATELNKIKPPYNISCLTQMIAGLVFEERDVVENQVNRIIEERKYLSYQLAKIDTLVVYPSSANFILVRIPNGEAICNRLEKRGVLVRCFGNTPLLKDCVRVTVGTREQNDILLDELQALLV